MRANWDYGDFEGRSSAEIRLGAPEWSLFRDGCPHGETPAQVTARADRQLTKLRTMSGSIALFTHGHFSGVLAARWLGLPILEAQHFPLDTASPGILAYAPHHPGVATIACWNLAAQRLCLS